MAGSNLLHVGQEEGHVVGRGPVLQHVVHPPLAGPAGLVARLGEVGVQQVPHTRVLHHLRPDLRIVDSIRGLDFISERRVGI